ncbi:hypothetical protein NFX31_14265 [Microbacterium azadirachtae]|uniref:DUF7882 family protein n=1 Tax=Microbacterium azadirachtae TaxID=582680 RepID=UPI0021D51AB0|nr:hypothetical protein [Microbacterium azadirachtae]UXW85358.1 hypothetical protein NFX31_14265 [Microbacterium azadirachtae]
MGDMYYGGSAAPIRIDDRVLAHLKIVITTKLRRGESFTVSWPHGDGEPTGRSSIWLHPAVPLRFVFDEPVAPDLDRPYLARLANAANSTGGIHLTAEDIDGSSGRAPGHEPRGARHDNPVG